MADLILFDLDNTLLDGDSDYAWGDFMCSTGIVDQKTFQRQNRLFYEQYHAGKLDIHQYLSFALKPLALHPPEKLRVWRKIFINTRIKPMIPAESKELVTRHRNNGDTTVIISATNRFVTEPIAKLFRVDYLIATELETAAGKFTGKPQGIPCFQEGKVRRFIQWLDETKLSFRETWFYSDSINDLPLLEHVDKPVIKNGDPEILKIAQQRGWPTIPAVT